MTEAAINARWNRDLLVALGEDVGKDSWSLRLQYRPMIRFIWLGALIMAIGGVTTVLDRRQRAGRGWCAAAARCGCDRASAATGPRTLNRFLLPLAAFVLLLVVLAGRL